MKFDGRRILRWHSVLLMTLTPVLTVGCCVVLFAGLGPYAGLAGNPMAVVDLAQAYPLMVLVAMAMWMGSRDPMPRRFSLLAIGAHCVPLSALAIFWGPIMESPIAPVIPLSFLIHGSGIAAEVISICFGRAPLSRRENV